MAFLWLFLFLNIFCSICIEELRKERCSIFLLFFFFLLQLIFYKIHGYFFTLYLYTTEEFHHYSVYCNKLGDAKGKTWDTVDLWKNYLTLYHSEIVTHPKFFSAPGSHLAEHQRVKVREESNGCQKYWYNRLNCHPVLKSPS